MQQLIAFLPFRALVDTPFRLYLGMLTGMAAVTALAHQIFWTVAFVLVGRAILTGHIRRLVVQGG